MVCADMLRAEQTAERGALGIGKGVGRESDV
ncbi:Uncharacterised protein [Mycobacteroides abscessus subsp. abscessus]|nr:Uncharacterised protein [Mycobacteroides abscessus subsp. abscessus]